MWSSPDLVIDQHDDKKDGTGQRMLGQLVARSLRAFNGQSFTQLKVVADTR